MRYVIFGAGAVGGVIGGRLHAAGRDVTLVARGDHLTALRQDGLTLATPDGEEHLRIDTAATIADAAPRAGDVVVLAVKSHDTAAALADLVAAAPPEVTVVCAQNGVVNEPAALRRFAAVYGMCVILPSQHATPGVVVQQSAPLAGVLDIGRYPSGADERATAIAADLEAASFRSMADPAIMRAKYRKLLMNLGNALDALSGWDARRSPLLAEATAEGEACLAAAGIDVQSVDDERARRHGAVSILPVAGHERGGSSSWQSLARGAGAIETDYLNGEIVLLGRLHGVPTPVNAALQAAANDAARHHRPAGSLPLAELEAMLARHRVR